MGRPRRLQLPGALYHVDTRGNDKQAIVLDEKDRIRFCRRFEETLDFYGWKCHSFCLMTTHYHALVETPEPNLAAGMHWLNNVYAKGFNLRHGRCDHVFGKRYYSKVITTEEQLVETVRYIALNPVEAGLCSHPAEWVWSYYGQLEEVAAGTNERIPDEIARLVALGEALAAAAVAA